MSNTPVTRRGVYKDLSLSPYEYKSPYGDIFKFSSAKRLEMYQRDIPKEVEKLEKLLVRNDMQNWLPYEIIQLLVNVVYRSFYRKIEG